MIGLDTNVLVRYLTKDDALQSPLALELIDSFTSQKPGFVSLVSLVETVWVLTDVLGYNRTDMAQVIETLLGSDDIHIQQADLVWRCLRQYRDSKVDFSDCVIGVLGTEAGCETTVTFDRQAAKLPGFRLLGSRNLQ